VLNFTNQAKAEGGSVNIKAVLFDMDGLIFDTEGVCKKSWQHAAREQGLDLSDAFYQHFIGVQDIDCESLLEVEFAEKLNMARFKRVRDLLLAVEREKDSAYKSGFEALFFELINRGFKCALVTSSALPLVQHHFSGCDYLSLFDALITSEQVKNGKPAADCYLMACAQLHLSPAECLVLEDSNNGMRSAIGAGCHAIMIPDLQQPDRDVAQQATAVLSNLLEVRQFL
jgi:HAD superfamily hydrolase (TIGR01509 family)